MTEPLQIRNFIDGQFVEPIGFCHIDRLLIVNSVICHSERSGAEPKKEIALTIVLLP